MVITFSPGRPSVLVVASARANHGFIADILQAEMECVSVTSVAEALESARVRTPELIVSSIDVESLDGRELYRRVRETPALKDVPFLLLTSGLVGFEASAKDDWAEVVRPRELMVRARFLTRIHRASLEARRRRAPYPTGGQAPLPVDDRAVPAERGARPGRCWRAAALEVFAG